MSIQEIIKSIMQNECVTQKELAEALGVTKQAVSCMLNGDDMKMSTVQNIVTALGYCIKIEKVKK